jgi:carbamoyl-phosphate synthase large subunit
LEKKTVLVTGIGGNVGQGIIRNIKKTGYQIKIVGVNISQMSAGNHLVDVFYKVPFGYEESYISKIIEIVKNNTVDLIIPSTDYEMYHLSISSKDIPCIIASSGPISSRIYLDKYDTAQFHAQNKIAFAETCLPSEFTGQYSPAIAKPRKGRGSKGLVKYVKSVSGLTDTEYIIQRMYEGVEITTAAYASYKTGKLHGLITMERSLENGATTFCKVDKQYDSVLENIARSMINNSDLKGAFNVQSIVSRKGEIFPFEVNCRISGTNSLRSHFGFNDVKYTLDELLYDKFPEPVLVTEGVAYRYLADVIYPIGVEKGTNTDDFILF